MSKWELSQSCSKKFGLVALCWSQSMPGLLTRLLPLTSYLVN